MDDFKLPTLKCRCGHEWNPRTPKKPKVCPKCKTPWWEEGYAKDRKGGK